ncbi:MAG: hypothetical protein GY752_05545, partial [bacterium]|nr:hypothetical protein [bacterium]
NVEDLVVGTPNAGRDDVLLHEMVGCIMETLAIRGDLKGHPSFSTLLKRQQLVVTDALKHANVPFSRTVQRLQVPRIENCNPIYQVWHFSTSIFVNGFADCVISTLPTSHRLCSTSRTLKTFSVTALSI